MEKNHANARFADGSDAAGHGWPVTQMLETRLGHFEFSGGYPVGGASARLRELQKLNRALEVYANQLMRVSQISTREGLRAFGATSPQHVVIWEQLMDAGTVLLTANTETVYAIAHLALDADGPTVIEAPPRMLGFVQDGLQRYLNDIGPLGPDKGQGGKFLILPPDWQGEVPQGYFVTRAPTYSALFAVRGFQVDNSTDAAVALMKQIRIYPLARSSSPPAMHFMNGSKQQIETVFHDTVRYFELLAMLVDEEPAGLFDPTERAQMQAIGIEKGRPFQPDAQMQALLDEAAHLGGAMARANCYDAPSHVFYYPQKHWQGIPASSDYTFARDGIPQIDARNYVYYMAAGNSPAMMEKNVGKGSQYLWSYRDADGDFLDGGKSYVLHVKPEIPAQAFWSVVGYDALSRSELQTGQALPSVSSYTHPQINTDGSVDIVFAPDKPATGGNWIQTLPGRGWFPIFRFYSPGEPFFDKSWQLDDIRKS